MRPGDAASLARYVLKRAPQYQLDPNAVIAVAIQEGISGHVGDNGTSFGPWQLHQGGAYPSSAPQSPDAANTWAWTPAGIDYALGRMQQVAGGLRGRQAVKAIVYRFERPADPAKEYQAAVGALPANDGGPSGGGGIGKILGGLPLPGVPGATIGGAVGAGEGAVHGAESVADFVGKLLDPHFWLRALEVVGGGVFLLFGLYLLGRQAGAPSVSSVASRAALATPQGRAIEGASMGRKALAGGG